MHLDTHLTSIEYSCKVGSDNGVDTLGLSSVDNATHDLHLRIVDNDVYCKVGLNTRSMGYTHNLSEVIKCKVYR